MATEAAADRSRDGSACALVVDDEEKIARLLRNG
jgi:hypothetical protein